ncbi:MAG: hypothetical protein ACYDH9_02270 [Limisphaerales bacterium]
MKRTKPQPQFALCERAGDDDDLIPRKLYQVVRDERAASDGLLRVIDESGEDYLYPMDHFVLIDLPPKAERALAAAA